MLEMSEHKSATDATNADAPGSAAAVIAPSSPDPAVAAARPAVSAGALASAPASGAASSSSSSVLHLTGAPFALSPSVDTAPLIRAQHSEPAASSSSATPAAAAAPSTTATADVRVAISADFSPSPRPQPNAATTGANGVSRGANGAAAAAASPASAAKPAQSAASSHPGSNGVTVTHKTVSSSSSSSLWSTWVLHPDSHRYRWWLLIVVLSIVANTWSVPFRLSVGYNRILGDITGFTGTDILFDLVYFMNILVKSRLAFFQEGALITDPHVIWQTYKARPGGLLLDACCCLPLDWILFASGNYIQSVFMRLLRLGQLLVIARYIGDLENSPGVNVTLVRLGKITMFYLLLSHLTGCAWFSFALPDEFGDNDWLPSADMLTHAYLSQYLRVLYWGLATLSDRIENPNPYTASQTAFMIVTQITGVLLLAYVIGNITFAIDDANETFQRHRLQLDYVQRFMTHAKLPLPMQLRVRKYYDHVWATNRGFDDFQMLKDLPASLRTDVCLQLTASTVGCNSLFQGLDSHFLSSLVKVLLQRTLVPDEILIREGEPGSEMYFIRSGIIVISVKIDAADALSNGAASPSPSSPLDSLSSPTAAAAWKGPTSRPVQTCVDGDLLGEYCVLLGDQCPVRSSSATAVGYCDLFVLRQDDLASLLSFYPSVQEELEVRTTRRRQLTLRKEENIIGLGRAGVAAAAGGANGPDSHRGEGGAAPNAAEAKDAKMKAKMAALLGGDNNNNNSSADLQVRPGSAAAGTGSSRGLSSSHSAHGGKKPPSLWRWYLLRLEHWSRTHWLVNSLWYENWTRLIALISLYNAICLPFRLAFDFSQDHPALLFVDYFTDCFLIVNVAATMWLRQPPKVGGHAMTASVSSVSSVGSGAGLIATGGTFESFSAARARYWKSGWMAWDIATSCPLDLLMLIKHEMNPWFRVGRVARFLTDLRVLSNANLQAAGLDGAAVGLCQLLTGFVLLTHWCSCAYWSFHYFLGFGLTEDSWLPKLSFARQGLLASYLVAQFETFVLLTGLGQKATPISDAEVAYVVFMILLGILLVAWAVGEVGERIANLDRFSAEFNRTCLNTYSFMSYRHFNTRLQKRVRDYLAHSWSTRHGVDPHVAMEGLPVGLRSEIMQHLCTNILMKVPLLARLLTADPTFSLGRHLIERLRFDSYPAGELIFQEGEIGESMFFITEGEVGIIVPQPQVKPLVKQFNNPLDRRGSAITRLSTQIPQPVPRHLQPQYATPSKILGAGSFFGEVGILGNGLRTASIRALKPVFLLVLNRAALLEIMEVHEEFAEHIREISATRAAKLAYIKARGAEEAEREALAAEQLRTQLELEGNMLSIEMTQNSPRQKKGVHFEGAHGGHDHSRSTRPSAGSHLHDEHVHEYGLEISRSQGDLHTHGRHHDSRQQQVDYLIEKADEREEEEEQEEQASQNKLATPAKPSIYGARLEAPKGRWARDHSGSRTDDSDDDHDQMVFTRNVLADGTASPAEVMAPDADDAEAAAFRRAASSGNTPKLSPITATSQSATTTDVALTIEGAGAVAASDAAFAVPPPLRIPSMPAEGVLQLESVTSQDGGSVTTPNLDAHQQLSGAPFSGSGTALAAFPASPRPALQPAKGHTRRKSGAGGGPGLGGGVSFFNAPSSTTPANRSLGGPTLQPRTSSINGPSGPPVLRGRESSALLDTPRGPPTDMLRRLERQTSFKQMRPATEADDADLTSGALSARSSRGLSRRLESAPMSASPARMLRNFSSHGPGSSSADSDALPGQDSIPASPLFVAPSQDGSIHTPSFARMTSSTAYSKSGHSSGPQIGSARQPLSSGGLSARGPLSPAMGNRSHLSGAAQFFARQSSIGTRSTGADPHNQSNPIAAATHSNALAPAQATLLSSHDQLTGDDIPPVMTPTRMRSLDRRTISSTAPAELPLSVFAQARRLHAERTIEAAVRCGVVRSEAELADVVTAVEAQLEEKELERREVNAAVEAGQEPHVASRSHSRSAHPSAVAYAQSRPGTGGRSQRPSTLSPTRATTGGDPTQHSRSGSLDAPAARLSVSKLAAELAAADGSPRATPPYSPFVPSYPLAYGGAQHSATPPQHPQHQPHLPHAQPVSVNSPPPAHPGNAQASQISIHLQTPMQTHNRRIDLSPSLQPAPVSHAAAPTRLHLHAQGLHLSPEAAAVPTYTSRLAAPYVASSSSSSPASAGAAGTPASALLSPVIEAPTPLESERGGRPVSSTVAGADGAKSPTGGWNSPAGTAAPAGSDASGSKCADRTDSIQSPLLARVRGSRSANVTFVPSRASSSALLNQSSSASSAHSSPSSLNAAAGPTSLSPSPGSSLSPNTLAARRPVSIHRSPAKPADPPINRTA